MIEYHQIGIVCRDRRCDFFNLAAAGIGRRIRRCTLPGNGFSDSRTRTDDEFDRFGKVLATTKAQLETVARSIGQAETRTRQMARKLKDVEALPVHEAASLLGESPDAEEDEAAA